MRFCVTGGITPNCPTDTADTNYREGCNPPINVSATAQTKTGGLSLGSNTAPTTALDIFGNMRVGGNAVFLGGVQIANGAGASKVLTSDASGNASWQDAVGGGSITSYNNLPSGASAGYYGEVLLLRGGMRPLKDL